MTDRPRTIFSGYVRNFIFGVEDSLVSTVGLLSGIATGGMDKQAILLTGTILIFVEAFSMGIGSYLSEQSTEEYLNKKETTGRFSRTAAVIMFVSYFIAGFIPLAPYLFFSQQNAFTVSISCSLIGLALLGITSAKILQTSLLRGAARMFLIGGFAVLVGIIVGYIFKM